MSARCELCFRHCLLAEGQTGFCRARSCQGGEVRCTSYGQLTALALDPIEKKPLRQFRPGSVILSAGSYGCNLTCPFCQNSSIAQSGPEAAVRYCTPEQLVALAVRLQEQGNIGLAYTYNEPLVGYEFVRDCAVLCRRAGLANVLVTNGTLCEGPWRALLPLLDAVNIDLKGFTEGWYRRLGGDLETVKRNIRLTYGVCHLEVTTLLVTDQNDSREEVEALARWLASISPEIPLHLSRFYPRYRMQELPPTPVERVYQRAEEARQYLNHVYTGNC